MGVELFFNVPQHPEPTVYAYHAVTVHANYSIMPDTTQTIQQVTCDADFMGQLTAFLSKGWRLVNICIDITAIAEGGYDVIMIPLREIVFPRSVQDEGFQQES
jgi:hypothetical protein